MSSLERTMLTHAAVVSMLAGVAVACGGAQSAKQEPVVASTADNAAHDHHAHKHPGKGHAHHHRFVDADAWSKMFDDPKRDTWQNPDFVVSAMAIEAGMTVVDIGAGTGYFEGRLDQAVGDAGRVLALDVEAKMAEFMEARAAKDGWKRVEARVIPTDDPQLSAQTADRILIVNTWHHIENRIAYASKLKQALKPGGFVMIVDFNSESPHGPPVASRLRADEVAKEFEAAGLSVSHIANNLPYQYVVAGKRTP